MVNDIKLNRFASYCSIVAFTGSAVGFVRQQASSSYPASVLQPTALPSGNQRLYLVLLLGLAAAIAGGICWSLIERFCGWKIGAGGENEGWSAIAASLCTTVPVLAAPVVYERVTHTPVTFPRHLFAAIVAIILNALAWILVFGWKSVEFRGVRQLVHQSRPTLGRRLKMELIWTGLQFASVVLVYRIIVDSQFGALNGNTILRTIIPAGVFFFGMFAFSAVRYPESIENPLWVQIRGVVGGLLLVVTFTGGILM